MYKVIILMNKEEIRKETNDSFKRLAIAEWKCRDNVKTLFSQMKEVGSGTYGYLFVIIPF